MVAVEQEDDVREVAVAGRPVLVQRSAPTRSKAAVRSRAALEHREEPLDALGLVRVDHAAAVREHLDALEAAARHVEAVEVQVGRPQPAGQRRGEGAQCRRLTGAGGAVDQQVTVGAEVEAYGAAAGGRARR